jgi:hypothetical protein
MPDSSANCRSATTCLPLFGGSQKLTVKVRILVDTAIGKMGHRLAELGEGACVNGFALKMILDDFASSRDEPFILKVPSKVA